MIHHERRGWLVERTKFWLWQAFVSLLAAYIGAQHFRHGTVAVRPTASDIVPVLIAFGVIFAAVVGVTHLAAHLDEDGRLGGVGDEEER